MYFGIVKHFSCQVLLIKSLIILYVIQQTNLYGDIYIGKQR